ncbi:MAG: acyl-CoA dehydrogenase protein, partial [Ramlibacter sp.]|nr:acyl-CoA dehydrogenase protein [Ramlibacter sp.]
MNFSYSPTQLEIAEAVRGLCARYPDEYWRRCDAAKAYPEEFVAAMTEAGWLASLIPEQYGGSGLGLLDACVILQEINAQGGNGAACHAQMYTMASVLQHGSEQQKKAILPRIA